MIPAACPGHLRNKLPRPVDRPLAEPCTQDGGLLEVECGADEDPDGSFEIDGRSVPFRQAGRAIKGRQHTQ